MYLNQGGTEGISLRELFFILRRWRTLVVSVTLIGVALAVFAGLKQPNFYSATALILVQARENRIVDFRNGADQLIVDAPMLETHVKVLQSRDLALRVVDGLELTNDPEFRRSASSRGMLMQWISDGWATAVAAVPPSWIQTLGLPTALSQDRPVSNDPGLSPERSVALAVFASRLTVTQSGKSYVLAVNFWADNPHKAARIANATADGYLDMLGEDKRGASIAANRWLGERLTSLRDEYLRARTREQNFRTINNIVTITNGEDVNDRQLIQLQETLIVTQAERAAAAAKLTTAEQLRAQGVSLEALSEIADSEVVQYLREQDIVLGRLEADLRKNFGERHPRMLGLQAEQRNLRDKLAVEFDRVVANLRNAVSIISARERAITDELARVNAAKNETGVQSVELAAIHEQTEASRRLYETFLQRYEETKQQADLITPDAKVVSRAAAPDAPTRVSLKFFGVVGLVASAFAASFAAIIADRGRATARRGQDLEEGAEISCLGMIAQLTPRQVRRGALAHLSAHPRASFAESMRSLVTTLQLAGVRRSKQVIAVTSALPREGKSTVSTSLAYTFARLGHRTLLIDLDLRRPKVGTIFGVSGHHSLAEVIAGSVKLEHAVLPNVADRLDVLPAQSAHDDPVALFSSPSFRTLLADVTRHYDWVILDCPPTLGMSDARLVGQAGVMMLFVVRWDQTGMSAIQTSVKDLKLFGADLVGSVINGVDLKKFRAFGLGATDQEGYYREYKTYYENA